MPTQRQSLPVVPVLVTAFAVFMIGGAAWKDQGLFGQTVAAWVQAFGSIGAIWAAVRVATQQTAERDRRDREAELKRVVDARTTASGLISAARQRLNEVNKSIEEGGGPSIPRCRLWKSSLSVEAGSLARIDTPALRDSRLVTVTNSVLVQIEHALVCLDQAMVDLALPAESDRNRAWFKLKGRLEKRLENVENRVSEFANLCYPKADEKGPVQIEPGVNDDEDLEDL